MNIIVIVIIYYFNNNNNSVSQRNCNLTPDTIPLLILARERSERAPQNVIFMSEKGHFSITTKTILLLLML